MTQQREIYQCDRCGNIIEVIGEAKGTLSCCDQPMTRTTPKDHASEGKEKHVPVMSSDKEQTTTIRVGSKNHPMEEDHYIAWIEVLTTNQVLRQELQPGDEPKATFACTQEEVTHVRAYCTKHGLW